MIGVDVVWADDARPDPQREEKPKPSISLRWLSGNMPVIAPEADDVRIGSYTGRFSWDDPLPPFRIVAIGTDLGLYRIL